MNPIDLVLTKLLGARPAGQEQWSARCPSHPDRNPSLSVSVGNDDCVLLHCHAGCSLEKVCAAMGIAQKDLFPPKMARGNGARAQQKEQFSAIAPALWALALERARSEDRHAEDEAVYAYLRERGLEESWEHGAYGILSVGMKLPVEVAAWPGCGCRLIVPLLDLNGEIVNVQARRVHPGTPKTLLPKGSRARATVFASRTGVELLRSPQRGGKVLLGEGLTDFLALSIVAPVPVLSAPGTSFFESAIGAWVADQDLYLAADLDAAGTACIKTTARAAHRSGARSVSFINWPERCKDACGALVEVGPVGLAEFLERELLTGGRNGVA